MLTKNSQVICNTSKKVLQVFILDKERKEPALTNLVLIRAKLQSLTNETFHQQQL
jgi:hypothetical protein